MRKRFKSAFLIVPALLALTGCVQTGMGGGPVTGSAGGQTSVGASSGLIRCDQTLGTLAIDDSRREDWWGRFQSETGVTNLEPMIRLMAQQSNCFMITSAGNSDLDAQLTRITQLQRGSGEYRAGSKQHKGQRIAADYYLQPTITFQENDMGGLGGAVGGLGGWGSVIGGVAGSMRQNSATVNLSLFDVRSATQIAASAGDATGTSFGGLMSGFGGAGGGVLSGYSNTPAGQTSLAAFADAYNKMVVAVRNYKAQNIQGGAGTGGLLQVQQ